MSDGPEVTLSSGDRAELAAALEDVVADAQWGWVNTHAAVERIVARHTDRALAEVERAIERHFPSGWISANFKDGYDKGQADALAAVRAARGGEAGA